MTSLPRVCLIGTVSDEGPWLLEWIAHNMAIGFSDIVLASNDCTDGTDAMLDRLQEMGIVAHVPNPGPYEFSVQRDAFRKAREHPVAAAADWLMVLDADEFLNVKTDGHLVTDLIARQRDDAQAIIVTWRNFGDGGHEKWADEPVCERYTMAVEEGAREVRYYCQVKTLLRNIPEFTTLTNHGPLRHVTDEPRLEFTIVTPDNLSVNPFVFQKKQSIYRLLYPRTSWETAQINHYITRTRDTYMLKRRRKGEFRRNKGRYSNRFYEAINTNHVEDLSIAATAERRREILEDLKSDPVLGKLHETACQHLVEAIAASEAAIARQLERRERKRERRERKAGENDTDR